ncbi:hypothetical protein TELCIR_04890 [Teladorsagia circumcincta]|uniref:Uncharacterized protein n=1 Tax=Teladorsagia circumcincta TaxID=45464 RepID=A0A2G9USN5_TELCI|nr:hypothetical protein TELCIR_04890 [Teladorsagia circumcincta]
MQTMSASRTWGKLLRDLFNPSWRAQHCSVFRSSNYYTIQTSSPLIVCSNGWRGQPAEGKLNETSGCLNRRLRPWAFSSVLLYDIFVVVQHSAGSDRAAVIVARAKEGS